MPFTFKLSQRLARMRCAALLLATATVAACEKPSSIVAPIGPGARLVTVTVSPAAITLVPSQTKQFTAFGRTEAGESTSVAVTWRTSAGTISPAGLFAAGQTAGTTQVTATDASGTISGTAAVTISLPSAAPVASVTVSPASVSVTVGGIQQFTATLKDASGNVLSGRSITWSSNALPVATVSTSGLATGLVAGTVTMTATSEGQSGSATFTVTAAALPPPPPPPPTGGTAPWIEEDFSRYLSTVDFLSDPLGLYSVAEDNTPSQIVLDRSVGVPQLGLTQSMRYDYIAPGCSSQSVGRNLVLPSAVSEVWIELYLKWSANFSTSAAGGCATPPAHKLLFARVGPGLYGRWEVEWGNQGPPQAIYWGYPSSGGGVQDQFGFANAPAYWDNTWHRVRFHFKNSTSTSASDGAFQMWVDDQLMVNRSGIRIDVSSYIYGIALGRNLDQGIRSGTMSLWWGRVRVWNQSPSW